MDVNLIGPPIIVVQLLTFWQSNSGTVPVCEVYIIVFIPGDDEGSAGTELNSGCIEGHVIDVIEWKCTNVAGLKGVVCLSEVLNFKDTLHLIVRFQETFISGVLLTE